MVKCIYVDNTERVRAACVGDSITFGAYIEDPEGKYPYQLGRLLGESYDVRNFGSNGATLLQDGDYPYRKQPAFEAALKFDPHIVIIALGTNDTKPQNWKFSEKFYNDYNSLIEAFKDDSNRSFFLCLPPFVYKQPGETKNEVNDLIENEIIPLIKGVAEENNLSIIDLHTALSNKEQMFPDKLHPNCDGAKIIAEEVADAIKTIQIKKSDYPCEPVDWFGYKRYDFMADGLKYTVVAPEKAVKGRHWIWRAEFFGHEPQADIALLNMGWHVVYVDSAAGLYGSPKAVAKWDAAYQYLTGKFALSPKVALEGFSRGGLLVYNWAVENTDKVLCIYADAPVCDIKSWPGGKGAGIGSPEDWILCLKTYGLSEQEALTYSKNPIDNLEPLAKAKIPLLNVCGDSDDAVPMEENTLVLEKRYKQLGGSIKLITKKDCGHHPHSLVDPAPIVNFIIATVD